MVWDLVLSIIRYTYKAESFVECQVGGAGELRGSAAIPNLGTPLC